MSNKKYTYDNGRTRKDRVNVWQLEKRVKKLEAQIQSSTVTLIIKQD